METTQVQPEAKPYAEPQQEHQWLQKLVGEWTYEIEARMGDDQPPEKSTGTEKVRSLGNLWFLAEGQGEMSGCGAMTTLMTLGYDSQKQQFVGSWIGSMMTYLWRYEGELDTAANKLILNSEGPAMTGDDKMAKYRDVIEFQSDDRRTLTSHALSEDGQWHHFMTATYQRKH